MEQDVRHQYDLASHRVGCDRNDYDSRKAVHLYRNILMQIDNARIQGE